MYSLQRTASSSFTRYSQAKQLGPQESGLELLKYDVENAKKLTKDLLRDGPGVLLLTSDDSESLIRIRSVAFNTLKMCALKSQYDNGASPLMLLYSNTS